MHARLVTERAPAEVVHVFDADWRPAERVAAYAGYKADRPPDPEGLPEQFELLREVLEALGLPWVEAPGWEADDAIGTLCAQAGPDDEVDVVSGDGDLLQLVRDAGPTVRLLYTRKGVSDLVEFDEAAVEAAYGVSPSRYVEFATLRGDPSDGLPGVKGIGEKTARDLLARHGSLDELVAAAKVPGTLSPAVSRRLLEARPYLEAMRSVAPVRTDVALRWYRTERDDRRLNALAAARGIEGPVDRLREALGG
jgi:5'-3' exonuclease